MGHVGAMLGSSWHPTGIVTPLIVIVPTEVALGEVPTRLQGQGASLQDQGASLQGCGARLQGRGARLQGRGARLQGPSLEPWWAHLGPSRPHLEARCGLHGAYIEFPWVHLRAYLQHR